MKNHRRMKHARGIPAEKLDKYLIRKTRSANFLTLTDHIPETALIDYTVYGNSAVSDDNELRHLGVRVTDKNNPHYGKYHIPLVCRGANLFGGMGIVNEQYPLYLPAGSMISISKKYTGTKNGLFVFYDVNGVAVDYKPFSKAMLRNDRLTIVCRVPQYVQFVGWRESAALETQVELGANGTNYTPYQESRCDIFLDHPLSAGTYVSYAKDNLPPILLPDDKTCTISVDTPLQPATMTVSYYQDLEAYVSERVDDLMALLSAN